MRLSILTELPLFFGCSSCSFAFLSIVEFASRAVFSDLADASVSEADHNRNSALLFLRLSSPSLHACMRFFSLHLFFKMSFVQGSHFLIQILFTFRILQMRRRDVSKASITFVKVRPGREAYTGGVHTLGLERVVSVYWDSA